MTKILRYLWPRTAIIAIVCCSGYALAHIKNEASQFPDIEFSDSRFDIVVLVGAGIIPETPVFEPDKLISKRELAVWAALAAKLGSGGETPDIASLAVPICRAAAANWFETSANGEDASRNSFMVDATSPVISRTLPATSSKALRCDSILASRLSTVALNRLI